MGTPDMDWRILWSSGGISLIFGRTNSKYIPFPVQLSSVTTIIRSVGRNSTFIASVHVAHSTALGL